ncbi:MAG: ATP-grasp domain-containing protein [Acidimicrobiales bacterium]
MDDSGFSVLVSSAGRRVELVRAFRSALAELGVDGQVLAADRSWYSSAFHSADAGLLVPGCDDPGFVDRMIELSGSHRVGLIVPTIDPELRVYAEARERFAAAGVTVAVSSPEVVTIASDKAATNEWLRANGFPTVRQTTVAQAQAQGLAFPLVAKPRFGSAGIGVAVVDDPAALDVAARGREMVVEEVAPGQEHTIDCFVDRSGRCRCAVPRRRIEVRAGEVSKGVTVRSPRLEALAADVCEALPGAYGAITLQVFVDPASGRVAIIEVNARFGGGYPLSHEAGADFPRWLLGELTGRPSTASADGWRGGLVMLRYDAAVFVEEPPG